jgi:hypothetical protein
MPETTISLRLPDGLDALIRRHVGEAAPDLTDQMRRFYLVSILAAVINGLEAPLIADAFVRLNGGYIVRDSVN